MTDGAKPATAHGADAAAGALWRDRIGEATRNAHLWLPAYLWSRGPRRRTVRLRRLWVTIADHFEPCWAKADAPTARERVARWSRAWPEIAKRHEDSGGRSPRYTFFYPQEEYAPELVEPLAVMTRAGIGDVEVHIHHDGGGEQEFLDRMSGFLENLSSRHGLLRRHADRFAFGFIHGNWALDNSRPDGRWCGLNNEISLLRDLGCYADFTLPAAPSPCQAGPVNVIFRVTDDPVSPRSHSRGAPVLPGSPAVGDLTLIPGPLGLSWKGRPPWKPRLETGELTVSVPPSRQRARRWLALAPRIGPDVFLKLFTHGAQERNSQPLLGGGLDMLFSSLADECRDQGIDLRYVSAWEMWRAVEALRVQEEPLAAVARPPRA